MTDVYCRCVYACGIYGSRGVRLLVTVGCVCVVDFNGWSGCACYDNLFISSPLISARRVCVRGIIILGVNPTFGPGLAVGLHLIRNTRFL